MNADDSQNCMSVPNSPINSRPTVGSVAVIKSPTGKRTLQMAKI